MGAPMVRLRIARTLPGASSRILGAVIFNIGTQIKANHAIVPLIATRRKTYVLFVLSFSFFLSFFLPSFFFFAAVNNDGVSFFLTLLWQSTTVVHLHYLTFMAVNCSRSSLSYIYDGQQWPFIFFISPLWRSTVAVRCYLTSMAVNCGCSSLSHL